MLGLWCTPPLLGSVSSLFKGERYSMVCCLYLSLLVYPSFAGKHMGCGYCE